MTGTRERSCLTPVLASATAALASLGLVACAAVGEGPKGPAGEQGTEVNNATGVEGTSTADGGIPADPNAGGAAGGGLPLDQPCAQIAANAKTVLSNYCASCHGPGSEAKGGFGTILDVNAMITAKLVTPKDADKSPLYSRLSTDTMPPKDVQKRPAAKDVKTVQDWIACGAPDFNDSTGAGTTLPFTSIDDRLRLLLDDVRSFENPTDRQRIRYIDLTNMANAGYSDEQLNEFREAIAFLLNSISLGSVVVSPEAVNPQKTIYRMDLRDYGWSAATWEQIVAIYPYAVQYNQDSRLFPYDEVSADQLRRETGTNIPYVQADWILSHASRPPLYWDILQLPDNLSALAQQLGINLAQDVRNQDVARAGFQKSGVSVNNRIIERHELPGRRGAFWQSHDFANNVATSNIFAHPLDFKEAGGEFIFNLQNGMQGYYVSNNLGVRLDKAPTNIVTDPNSRDKAVEAGLSCLTCHQTQGILPKDDSIRGFVTTNAKDAAEREAVFSLYLPVADMRQLIADDQNRYQTARNQAGISQLTDVSMHRIVNAHEGTLTLADVASVLGVTEQELESALDASPQAFPPEIVSLRQQGGTVQRDVFEAEFNDLLTALGLGVTLPRNSRVSSR